MAESTISYLPCGFEYDTASDVVNGVFTQNAVTRLKSFLSNRQMVEMNGMSLERKQLVQDIRKCYMICMARAGYHPLSSSAELDGQLKGSFESDLLLYRQKTTGELDSDLSVVESNMVWSTSSLYQLYPAYVPS